MCTFIQNNTFIQKILLIENSKIKKNKELVHEDIITIQQEIHRIFAETFQELNAMGFHLTHEDQLFAYSIS